jgi:hypothetical protein
MADKAPPHTSTNNPNLNITPPPPASVASSTPFTPRNSTFPDGLDSESEFDAFDPTPVHSPTGPHYDDLPPTYDEAQQQALQEARSGATHPDPNDLEVRRLTLSHQQPPSFEAPHTNVNTNTSAPQRSRTSLIEDPNAYEFEPENRPNAHGLGRTVPIQQAGSSERIPVGRSNPPAAGLPTYGSVNAAALLERALGFTQHRPDADVRFAPRLSRLVAIPQEGVPPSNHRKHRGGRHGRGKWRRERGRESNDAQQVPGQWPSSPSNSTSNVEAGSTQVPLQFTRAYSKALHAHSIRPAEFTEFLDGLNAICNATSVNLSTLSNDNPSSDSIDDTLPAMVREYISRANTDFFAPRGLTVRFQTLDELVQVLQIPEERSQRAAAVASALDESVTTEKRAQGIYPWVEALETGLPGPSSRTLVMREMGDRYRNQPTSPYVNYPNEKERYNEDDEDPPHSVPDSPPGFQPGVQPFPFGGWGARGPGVAGVPGLPGMPGVPGVPGIGAPWGSDHHGRGWRGGPQGYLPQPDHHNTYAHGRRGFGGPDFPFGPRGGPGRRGVPFAPRGFGPGTPGQNNNNWSVLGQSIGKWGEEFGKSWGKWGEEVGKRAGEWGNDVGRQFAEGPSFGAGARDRGQSSSHAYGYTGDRNGLGTQDMGQETGHVYGGGSNGNGVATQESGVLRDYKDRALAVPPPVAKDSNKGKEKVKAKTKTKHDDDDSDSSSSDSSSSDSESEDEEDELPTPHDLFLARLREINIAAQASTAKGKKSAGEIAAERALAIEKAQNDKTAAELKWEEKREKRALKRELRQKKREINREHKRVKRELRRLKKQDSAGKGEKSGKDKSGKREEKRKAREEYREKKREIRKVKEERRREWREDKRERRRGGCGKDGGADDERAGEMIWIVIENLERI